MDSIKAIISIENGILKTEHVLNINKGIDVLILIIKASLPDLKLETDTNVLKQLKNLEDGKNNLFINYI